MIIRILGEGQYEFDDHRLDELNVLDARLQDAVDAADPDLLRSVLTALLDLVRTLGTSLGADVLVPSELVLPAADAGLDELRDLLTDEGLVPG
ncbi:PspA-associated protein PspAA [Prauserella cavernicola]|uniref:PspA-associated domain-containing protein n=1 Tax=Prauserella cavernicola TaxID=2800127 RepID=A0A934QNJ3_9PSEU|nr:hypothetical protein [Prauserella cavernicola]MBK1783906.1 hypothetical protein [Prauserella cavernicola]